MGQSKSLLHTNIEPYIILLDKISNQHHPTSSNNIPHHQPIQASSYHHPTTSHIFNIYPFKHHHSILIQFTSQHHLYPIGLHQASQHHLILKNIYFDSINAFGSFLHLQFIIYLYPIELFHLGFTQKASVPSIHLIPFWKTHEPWWHPILSTKSWNS